MFKTTTNFFKKKLVPVLFVIMLLLSGCTSTRGIGSFDDYQKPNPIIQKFNNQKDPAGWWKDAVVYEIFVRSFMDGNGDGIGDINGLISKLDYLNDGDPMTNSDLGVNAIWLMPIFPATSYHGYDATDYKEINPDYGTLEDIKTLIAAAHEREIKVILDLPINHTSNLHPWFQSSLNDDPHYSNYYLWSDDNPDYKGPMNEVVWHPAENGKFYYGIFNAGMPDLNYSNPKVTEEMENIVVFWVEEMGVDGFRLDAAQYLIEEGQRQDNTQSTHTWYRRLNKFITGFNPNILTVGEIWNSSQQAASYIQGEELNLAFNFDLARAIVSAAGGRVAEQLKSVLQKDYPLFRDGIGLASFLTNHDMARAMNSFSGDTAKAKSAATILLTLPGTPFIYYGEEIGMTGEKPDPQIRTPMQWSPDDLAGFTTGKPWQPINPDPGRVNIAEQLTDPASLLSHYRALIRIRQDNPVLRDGDLHIVDSGNRRIYAILRSNAEDAFLVLINLGNEDLSNQVLSLTEGPLEGCFSTQPIFGETPPASIEANASGGFDEFIPIKSLPANSNFILQLVPCQ